jgi:hypothetical protein
MARWASRPRPGDDEVFFQLVVARIIEPVSKLDSLRVLEEAGAAPVSYPTVNRRLPAYAGQTWRRRLSAACAAHAGLGPASLVLYDCSADLTIVLAALAASRWIEHQAGLVNPQVRQDRPPLPHHPDPGRRPRHHRGVAML